jgi:hypothetical protein
VHHGASGLGRDRDLKGQIPDDEAPERAGIHSSFVSKTLVASFSLSTLRTANRSTKLKPAFLLFFALFVIQVVKRERRQLVTAWQPTAGAIEVDAIC